MASNAFGYNLKPIFGGQTKTVGQSTGVSRVKRTAPSLVQAGSVGAGAQQPVGAGAQPAPQRTAPGELQSPYGQPTNGGAYASPLSVQPAFGAAGTGSAGSSITGGGAPPVGMYLNANAGRGAQLAEAVRNQQMGSLEGMLRSAYMPGESSLDASLLSRQGSAALMGPQAAASNAAPQPAVDPNAIKAVDTSKSGVVWGAPGSSTARTPTAVDRSGVQQATATPGRATVRADASRPRVRAR